MEGIRELQSCLGSLHQRLTLVENQVRLGPRFNGTGPDPLSQAERDSILNELPQQGVAPRDGMLFGDLNNEPDTGMRGNKRVMSVLLGQFFDRLNQRLNVFEEFKLEFQIQLEVLNWLNDIDCDKLVRLFTNPRYTHLPDQSNRPRRYLLFQDSVAKIARYLSAFFRRLREQGSATRVNMDNFVNITRDQREQLLLESGQINTEAELNRWYLSRRSDIDLV